MFSKTVILHSKCFFLLKVHCCSKILFLRSQPSPVEDENDSELPAVGAFNNSELYNAMVHPFTRMVITGVVWYQGKS
jgi:hypothetical protein